MEGGSESCDMKMAQTAITDSENGGQGTSTKEGRWTLEAEKARKCVLPYSLHNETQPFQHLDFNPRRHRWDF